MAYAVGLRYCAYRTKACLPDDIDKFVPSRQGGRHGSSGKVGCVSRVGPTMRESRMAGRQEESTEATGWPGTCALCASLGLQSAVWARLAACSGEIETFAAVDRSHSTQELMWPGRRIRCAQYQHCVVMQSVCNATLATRSPHVFALVVLSAQHPTPGPDTSQQASGGGAACGCDIAQSSIYP